MSVPAGGSNGAVEPGRPRPPLALVLAAAIALASLGILFIPTSHAGLTYSWKDPAHYLGAARGLAAGEGLAFSRYDVAADRLVHEPLTHFPPLVSTLLGGLLIGGVELHHAPLVVNGACWLLFLTGSAVLVVRASGSWNGAAYAVALSAVAWPYLDAFSAVSSEPLFLALLVWLAAALTGLPRSGVVAPARLGTVIVLASLLPLTRYVGVFFLIALFAWWAAVRWRGTERRRLLGELTALALAGLPLLAWLTRNWLLTSSLVGHGHVGGPGHGFSFGLEKIAVHSTWLFLPTLRPGAVWRELGLLGALPLVLSASVVVGAAWVGRQRSRQVAATPLPAFLAAYLGVYAFLQPFLAFTPMNRRFVTVALCLAIPWLVVTCSRAPRTLFHTALGSLLVVNLGLLGAIVERHAARIVVAHPPFVVDMAGRPGEVAAMRTAGVPRWLLHPPPRLRDLDVHLWDLDRRLRHSSPSIPIVSNAPSLFPARAVARSDFPIADWLARGRCETRQPLLLVLVAWDRWRDSGGSPPPLDASTRPQKLVDAIHAKCPALFAERTRNAWIFELGPPAGSSRSKGRGSAPP